MPLSKRAVFRVNALQESLEGYWRTNIQAEHAAGFIQEQVRVASQDRDANCQNGHSG